jgi:ribose 5-phosphate isomerase B
MIYLGADHRGYKLKEKIKKWFEEWGEAYKDLGAMTYNSEDDYSDFGIAVGEAVAKDKGSLGIVGCGSGIGISVAVNKVKGARAAVVFNEDGAFHARNSDELNVLSLPVDYLSESQAKKVVEIFLKTKFSGEKRHKRRIGKIQRYEIRDKR